MVGWFGKCQSIRKVGGRRFVEGLYQALFSFRLARRNVITKRNENWAWSQVTFEDLTTTSFIVAFYFWVRLAATIVLVKKASNKPQVFVRRWRQFYISSSNINHTAEISLRLQGSGPEAKANEGSVLKVTAWIRCRLCYLTASSFLDTTATIIGWSVTTWPYPARVIIKYKGCSFRIDILCQKMSIVWFLKCCYKLCINVFETKSPGKQVCFPSRWSQETSRLAEKRNKLNISGPGIKCVLRHYVWYWPRSSNKSFCWPRGNIDLQDNERCTGELYCVIAQVIHSDCITRPDHTC